MSLCLFFFSFPKKISNVKFVFSFPGCQGQGTWMEEALTPGPNFNRPVKDLVYKDLLTSTFTQASHDRGIKTWRASASYPQCVFSGNKFRYETFNVECQWTPTLEKKQSVRKGPCHMCLLLHRRMRQPGCGQTLCLRIWLPR